VSFFANFVETHAVDETCQVVREGLAKEHSNPLESEVVRGMAGEVVRAITKVVTQLGVQSTATIRFPVSSAVVVAVAMQALGTTLLVAVS